MAGSRAPEPRSRERPGRVLELELARAGRQGSEVSFAMFDVDDFRATNQEGGHEAGEANLPPDCQRPSRVPTAPRSACR